MIKLDWRRVHALQDLWKHTKGDSITLIDEDHVKWVNFYNKEVILTYNAEKAQYFYVVVDNTPQYVKDQMDRLNDTKREITRAYDSDIPKY
jgi:hypothetical protein